MGKQYQPNSLEELAADPAFQAWVLNPTPDNRAYWLDFLDKHPEKADLVEEAKNLILGIHHYFGKEPTDPHQLAAYYEEISQRSEQTLSQQSSSLRLQRIPYRQLAVASIVLLLATALGWWWTNQSDSIHTYSTAYGEWQTVILPDSSRVKLNANSELSISRNWKEESNRTVWLTGEAYFEILRKPTSGATFTVIADEVSVEVLGTSFNVNSRGEKTEVFLEEGKIRLAAGNEETFMVPGDFIAYSADINQFVEKRQHATKPYSSWKDGVLVVQESPIREIFNKIEDIYGIEFQVKDSSVLETTTTVRLPMDKLEIALPILEKTLGRKIQQKEKRLIVQ
ncbi:MAG: FecR domain-containing protein [Bacteroidota bacterium]